MQKTKKLNLSINIVFCAFLLIVFMINSINIVKDLNIECLWSEEQCRKLYQEEYSNMSQEERNDLGLKPIEQLSDKELKELVHENIIKRIPIVLLISFILTVLDNLFFIIIFIIIKVVNNRFIREKLDKVDFEKTKEYYREILEGFDILELSWIDDFNLDLEKDIIAELIQLESSKIIRFDEEKIIVNKSRNLEKLKSSQKYILEHIKDGKITNINKFELEQKIREDAITDNLIEEKNKQRRRKISKIGTLVIIFIIMMRVMNTILESYVANPIIIIIMFSITFIITLLLFFYPAIVIVSTIVYAIKYQMDPYFRTGKGKELNKKIEGLKIYLKDYTLLHEQERESVAIWEDYLAYSVLFNQNKKIIEEYKKYIENKTTV